MMADGAAGKVQLSLREICKSFPAKGVLCECWTGSGSTFTNATSSASSGRAAAARLVGDDRVEIEAEAVVAPCG